MTLLMPPALMSTNPPTVLLVSRFFCVMSTTSMPTIMSAAVILSIPTVVLCAACAVVSRMSPGCVFLYASRAITPFPILSPVSSTAALLS